MSHPKDDAIIWWSVLLNDTKPGIRTHILMPPELMSGAQEPLHSSVDKNWLFAHVDFILIVFLILNLFIAEKTLREYEPTYKDGPTMYNNCDISKYQC